MPTELPKLPGPEKGILEKMMADCSGMTAKALSETLSRPIDVISTSVNVLLINRVPELCNPDDFTAAVLSTRLKGDIEGVIIISSSVKSLLRMADIALHKKPGHFRNLSDKNLSAIRELAGILVGYYITALNHALNEEYVSTTPVLSVNPRRAIEDMGFGSVYTEEIHVLVLRAGFIIKEEDITEDIFILFRKEAARKILQRLK